MHTQLEEAEWNLQEKDKHVSKLQDQERHLDAGFLEAIGESKFKDYLMKVFKRKIKRVKQKTRKEKGEWGQTSVRWDGPLISLR